jgi:hypothetical protein
MLIVHACKEAPFELAQSRRLRSALKWQHEQRRRLREELLLHPLLLRHFPRAAPPRRLLLLVLEGVRGTFVN